MIKLQVIPISPFIPTISYSPAPSLPLPRPLPRPDPCSSSPSLGGTVSPEACVLLDPPNAIGRNSRHWQLHTPRLVIMPALAICSPHHSQFRGIECEYKDVIMKWMKWSVRAKSGTSLLRDIKKRIAITLKTMLAYFNVRQPRVEKGLGERGRAFVPKERVEEPNEAQHPAYCRITSYTSPTKYQIHIKMAPRDQRRE